MRIYERVVKCLSVMTVVFVFSVTWPQPTLSHHSFTALRAGNGQDAIFVLEGTVRAFRVLNPHGALIINSLDDAAETLDWLIELSPAAQLTREGWSDDTVADGDRVTAVILPSTTPGRARLRALLIHGKGEGGADQLLVSYGIRGDTPVMQRLKERLPVCGIIDSSLQRTECFLVDEEARAALDQEFPGPMGFLMP